MDSVHKTQQFSSSELIFIKDIQNVQLLSFQNAFMPSMDFSDKVIFPPSVLVELKILNVPMPPVLILAPNRSYYSKVYCSVLDFTAEEDCVCVPFWAYRELGYKSKAKNSSSRHTVRNGYGIKVFLAPLKENAQAYVLPKLQVVKLSSAIELDVALVKEAIRMYSVIREGKDIYFSVSGEKKSARVVQVMPAAVCLIGNEFEVVVGKRNNSSTLPDTASMKSKESNRQLGFDSFPTYPERIPRFLIEIMAKSSSVNSKPRQRRKPNLTSLITIEAQTAPTRAINHKSRLPYHLKSENALSFPIVHSTSKPIEPTSSPKVLNFNLPQIHISSSKPAHSKLRSSVCIEKWFRPQRKRAFLEETLFEIVSQARQS
jgi:hypothetical protein